MEFKFFFRNYKAYSKLFRFNLIQFMGNNKILLFERNMSCILISMNCYKNIEDAQIV